MSKDNGFDKKAVQAMESTVRHMQLLEVSLKKLALPLLLHFRHLENGGWTITFRL